ncbi:hypothetical protein [Noviherbaspirillum pedocola]|uniref:Uncharacterized protein n=1 Tax=Noviherbaspirillum pedocola TaxID=2801341 RepID=A0A934SV14_9BURK|nr:hypothetical protein [Noviherbaspirillum pedocola]MBK4736099.1 hypothetical protein [Noviherbaspirillum pedocola]
MDAPDFLIRNCKAANFVYACPKLWSQLKPAFSDNVRHCDHCNRKVYLCRTDADLQFYTSVDFCIAIADIDIEAEQMRLRRQPSIDAPGVAKPVPEQSVRLIGIPWPAGRGAKSVPRTPPGTSAEYDIPAYLRRQQPDSDEKK